MESTEAFQSTDIQVVLTDIDGTLTDNGRLPDTSYSALWKLAHAGFSVIPITGRPAGWCELIARLWPVHGVIGENGAFYFRYKNHRMKRVFAHGRTERLSYRRKLKDLQSQILREVPRARIASDQFCRLFDLAVDFSEDVHPPLNQEEIQKIVSLFKKQGAHAKVSNIHVNGWFGDYDKLTACKAYLRRELEFSEEDMRRHCAFIGDSPNDEPMFGFFPNSFAVANIQGFLGSLKQKPAYVTTKAASDGFCEFTDRLLVLQSR